jgi:mono/diheme cytochrome c family protein
MKKLFSISFPFLAASLIMVGCAGFGQNAKTVTSPQGGSVKTSSALQIDQTSEADPANGEQIYFMSTDKSGNRILYTGGPNFGGMMMGGYLTCASCHGPDAHGGLHVMHMETMDAPPIYYAALVGMMAEESNGTQQPEGYTLENFRKEVEDGIDVNGEQLDENMPRWQMSEQDLADLFAFLKTIPK